LVVEVDVDADVEADDVEADDVEVVDGVADAVVEVEVGAAAASGNVSGEELTVTPTNNPTATRAAPAPTDASNRDG